MSTHVDKSEKEWREQLTPEQYHVLREHGTERAFTGKYWDTHEDGTYHCAACGAQLFSRNPEDPTQMSVRMSAFDGDPGVRPSWRAFVAYAAPWEPVPDDGLERFDERKPRD